MNTTTCSICDDTEIDQMFGGPCAVCAPIESKLPSLVGLRLAQTEAPWTFGGGGGSGRSYPATSTGFATEKQIAYIKALAPGYESMPGDSLTKRDASKMIDELRAAKAVIEAQAPATTGTRDATRRPNQYSGKCVKCGGVVLPGGYLAKDASGKWAAEHVECPKADATTPLAPKVELTGGMYRTPEGVIYKVQVAHHGSGELYAKELVGGDRSGWAFEYAKGAIRKLHPEWKMTLDEAKAFGKLYGVCCVCAAVLTDENSIAAGIGPICSGKGF